MPSFSAGYVADPQGSVNLLKKLEEEEKKLERCKEDIDLLNSLSLHERSSNQHCEKVHQIITECLKRKDALEKERNEWFRSHGINNSCFEMKRLDHILSINKSVKEQSDSYKREIVDLLELKRKNRIENELKKKVQEERTKESVDDIDSMKEEETFKWNWNLLGEDVLKNILNRISFDDGNWLSLMLTCKRWKQIIEEKIDPNAIYFFESPINYSIRNFQMDSFRSLLNHPKLILNDQTPPLIMCAKVLWWDGFLFLLKLELQKEKPKVEQLSVAQRTKMMGKPFNQTEKNECTDAVSEWIVSSKSHKESEEEKKFTERFKLLKDIVGSSLMNLSIKEALDKSVQLHFGHAIKREIQGLSINV
eukprot:TRINITY_DN2905_c0_g3_i1.p1 TRINITY_DN2905_c0_g3~~TRINITY_DN2905_c0_g3_i1.p1  ORF type:complete len:363 (-),score=137.40 TRINITY_DN2905_c0_g3_i1:354-1442(-)